MQGTTTPAPPAAQASRHRRCPRISFPWRSGSRRTRHPAVPGVVNYRNDLPGRSDRRVHWTTGTAISSATYVPLEGAAEGGVGVGRMPKLDGDAWAAVRHRGSHVQIIAAAGSGKTEVVSQRVADLLADGVPARGIVAFTFTERAAGELKNRITERVEERLGQKAVDALCGLFVGTIHAYCFRLLQTHVPRYETYDVLDDNQLTAFLSREMPRLGLKQFDGKGRHFAGIDTFVRSVDVVENERLDPDAMPEPFRTSLVTYLETLERYRLLTYGQQVGRAVEALARPEVSAAVHADLRHLIVDEYQDVNPAQEELIRLLAGPSWWPTRARQACASPARRRWPGSSTARWPPRTGPSFR